MSVHRSHRSHSKRQSATQHAAFEVLESRQLLSATLYAFKDGGSGLQPELVQLNTATGKLTNVGLYAPLSSDSEGPTGLVAAPSGTVYVLDGQSNVLQDSIEYHLATINPATGAVTRDIGPVGIDDQTLAVDSSGTPFTLKIDDTDFTKFLVSINPTTGAATTVGDTNLAAEAITSDGATGFYATAVAGNNAEELVDINESTAAVTVIGPTGFSGQTVDSLAVGSDGVLYGYNENTKQIVSFSTSTGSATVVSTVTGATTLTSLASLGSNTGATGGGTTGGGTTTTASVLTPTIGKSTLPAAVVSGSTAKGKVAVTVTNSGTAAVSGSATITLFATTTGVIDSASTNVGSLTIKNLPLKAGKSTGKSINVSKLSLPAGTYTLLAQATDSAGNVSASTTGPTLTVAAPFVSLSAVVGAVKPTSPKVGKPATFVVTITNAGNVDSTGDLTLAIGVSSDGTTLAEAVTSVTKKNAKVKSGGKALKVSAHFKVPTDLPFFTLYPFVTITQGTTTLSAVGPSFLPLFSVR